MNKNQLIASVTDRVNAEGDGSSKATLVQSRAFVDAFLAVVQDAVAEGDKVTLPGFGTWERKFSEARTATNPATGGKIDVAARYRAAFKVGSVFKETVEKGGRG